MSRSPWPWSRSARCCRARGANAGSALGSIGGQAIASRGGLQAIAIGGMTLTGLGCLLLAHVSADGTYLGDIFFGLLVFGPGLGAAYVASSIASLAGIAEADAGLASG